MPHKPDEDLPPDDIYRNGMDFTDVILEDLDTPPSVQSNINWDKELNNDTHIRDATISAATQFHYANTSHLIICGRLIKQETEDNSLSATKLAAALTLYKSDDLEIWGRYLSRSGGGYSVSQPLRQYYRHLFSEDDALSTILGMEILGGPIAHTLYDTLQDTGNALFQDITAKLVPQKEQEKELVKNYATPAIKKRSAHKKEDIRATLTTYLELGIDAVLLHEKGLKQLDLNKTRLHNDVVETTERFIERIGLQQ